MNNINGKTNIYGLIGNPVEHTLSPMIHNMLSQHFGHNLVYVPFLVEEGDLEQAIYGAKALNIKGLNITVPYKSQVIPYLEKTTTLANQVGAVNTLIATKRGFEGYNTDCLGLKRALVSDGIYIEGKTVIIIGGGGAARATAFLCAQEGASHIYLLNRTLEKINSIASEIMDCYKDCLVEPVILVNFDDISEDAPLVFQTTSIGLGSNSHHAPIEEKEFYQKIKIGYDLIYDPFKTKFMSLVEEAGGKSYNGLKMLLYQGIIAYELWNNVTVTEELSMKIYEKLKRALNHNE